MFWIVIVAALLHATWNAIVKGAADKLLTTVMVTAAAALLAVALLPLLAAPDRASWGYIVVSALLQIGYFALVARTYAVADMSQAYPLMRGTAPLLVALAGVVWLRESLSGMAWPGVMAICAGILMMGWQGRRRDRTGHTGRTARDEGGGGARRDGRDGRNGDDGRGSSDGVRLALVNAVVIAGYTLIDGVGVRRSGAPAAYTLWVYLLTGLTLAAWALTMRRGAFAACIARSWHLGLIGGVGTVASYGLALWAMTLAPVTIVAALRETSIVFGTAIAWLFLGERLTTGRAMAALLIALGAAMLRLA